MESTNLSHSTSLSSSLSSLSFLLTANGKNFALYLLLNHCDTASISHKISITLLSSRSMHLNLSRKIDINE